MEQDVLTIVIDPTDIDWLWADFSLPSLCMAFYGAFVVVQTGTFVPTASISVKGFMAATRAKAGLHPR